MAPQQKPSNVANVQFLLVLLFLACGCQMQSIASIEDHGKGSRRSIFVAAAADLKFAFEDVIAEFQADVADIDVRVTYGSSGNLYAQLSNRAPFDIYFSADVAYPRRLIEQGWADQESELLYGIGQLAIWVSHDSPIDVERLGIQALTHPATTKIAIANPQHAPYGRAAESCMKYYGIYETVKDRLVWGDNIAQAAQFVESGTASVGILALALALAPPMKEKGRYWIVPLDAYPAIEQGSVILKWARDRGAAEQFRAFVAGPRGRTILQRYGFILPE